MHASCSAHRETPGLQFSGRSTDNLPRRCAPRRFDGRRNGGDLGDDHPGFFEGQFEVCGPATVDRNGSNSMGELEPFLILCPSGMVLPDIEPEIAIRTFQGTWPFPHENDRVTGQVQVGLVLPRRAGHTPERPFSLESKSMFFSRWKLITRKV